MSYLYRTVLLLCITTVYSQRQRPFFANKEQQGGQIDGIRIASYDGPPKGNEVTDVDAQNILDPIMSPFIQMYDVMQQNAKAKAYAEKIQQERDASPFSNSKGLFDLIEKLQRPTTTTTPAPSLMEQLLQPYWEPWQRQLDTISKEMAGITLIPTTTTTAAPTTTAPKSLLERSLGMFLPGFTAGTIPPQRPAETPDIRRSPPKLFDPERGLSEVLAALSSDDASDVRVGKDQLASILAKSLRQKEGLDLRNNRKLLFSKPDPSALNPSYGRNDASWNLLNRISSMIRDGTTAVKFLRQTFEEGQRLF